MENTKENIYYRIRGVSMIDKIFDIIMLIALVVMIVVTIVLTYHIIPLLKHLIL